MPAQAINLTGEQLTAGAPKRRRRPKRDREFSEIVSFLTRMVRAAGRRAGEGDPNDIAALVELGRLLDEITGEAVRKLNDEHGYSWADIAAACGVTKQTAHGRWARQAVDVAPSAPLAEGPWAEPTLGLRVNPRRRR